MQKAKNLQHSSKMCLVWVKNGNLEPTVVVIFYNIYSMKKCGIYKITSPSGKIYIGQSEDIDRRFYQYKKLQCKRQPKLYNSLNKYGVNNHVFEIIEECNKSLLNSKEKLYIKFFDSYKKGLNSSLGGETVSSKLLEVRKKQSNTRKKKFALGEIINPMLGRKKEKSGMYGKKHTKEALEKLNKVKRVGINNPKSRKVICSITNKIYESARQAWLELYSNQYKYSYFKCMLAGYNTNKTTLSYLN